MEDGAKSFYDENGYGVAHGVFSLEEAAEIAEHFMALRAQGARPGDYGGDPSKGPEDPLNLFPRMIHMHRWDKRSDTLWRDPRLIGPAKSFIGQPVELCQTMLYFKPPGARGQAHHQDNQYIRKRPLIGAWLALDPCDRANGCMTVVAASHKLGVLRVESADLRVSFTDGQTAMPAGAEEMAIEMAAGDVLFFDGLLIHGSHPNTTTDRFRRSFIVHYLGRETTELPGGDETSMVSLRKKAHEGV